MRSASLKHILTRPALLIAAGLVLLGAAAGRAQPGAVGASPASEGDRAGRAAQPALEALYRCLGASLVSESGTTFGADGLSAAFDPAGVFPADLAAACTGRPVTAVMATRVGLRLAPVGPAPPRAA